jgi:hypothetical protein
MSLYRRGPAAHDDDQDRDGISKGDPWDELVRMVLDWANPKESSGGDLLAVIRTLSSSEESRPSGPRRLPIARQHPDHEDGLIQRS